MAEHRIILESSGTHLNIVGLMVQCEVLLGEITVEHTITMPDGYCKVIVHSMELNFCHFLRGLIKIQYFTENPRGPEFGKDRFDRSIAASSLFVYPGRTLLDTLGLGKLFGTKRKPTEENALDSSKYTMRWEIKTENFILLTLDSKSLEKAVGNNLFDNIKTAILSKRRILLSNEIIEAMFMPVLQCLYEDWGKLLKF